MTTTISLSARERVALHVYLGRIGALVEHKDARGQVERRERQLDAKTARSRRAVRRALDLGFESYTEGPQLLIGEIYLDAYEAAHGRVEEPTFLDDDGKPRPPTDRERRDAAAAARHRMSLGGEVRRDYGIESGDLVWLRTQIDGDSELPAEFADDLVAVADLAAAAVVPVRALEAAGGD